MLIQTANTGLKIFKRLNIVQIVKRKRKRRQSIPHLETYEFGISAECLIYRLQNSKHYHIVDLNVLSLETKDLLTLRNSLFNCILTALCGIGKAI